MADATYKICETEAELSQMKALADAEYSGRGQSLPPSFDDVMAERFGLGDIWIAAVEATVVGFYTYRRVDDENLDMGWISVAPDYQSQGIGGELRQFVWAALVERGMKSLRFRGRGSDADSLAYYEALGAVHEGEMNLDGQAYFTYMKEF